MDDDGFVCLNDIHKAAGYSKNRRPFDWQRLPSTNPLIIATYERVTGKSRKSKIRISEVYKVVPGMGTWAHPILAAAYAGYLKPELEVEMKEVWLRYKSADATLADDILDRATDEENEWAATRALGRVKRFEYTKALDEHGVEGFGYANCTNAVYKQLFDATAKKLKQQKGLPSKANLRNAMSKDELVFVMMAETLAKGRIEEEAPQGNGPCAAATKRSAAHVRRAIDADKNDRQKPLV
ncbi:hypothetical protein A9320_22385 [Ruegeria sp. PBVC088]|nr:hypothetical protein A9320_22385 [Ruegeria sp. PBVC088]